MKSFAQILPAEKYYTHQWALGWILLIDGQPFQYDTKREATEALNGFLKIITAAHEVIDRNPLRFDM